MFRFNPWPGSLYGTSASVYPFRLLVIAESMYDKKGTLNADSIIQMIRLSIRREKGSHAFYERLRRVFSDEPDRSRFWDSIVFHNYVQVPVGTRPRQRPTDEDWETSKEPFRQVLVTFKPEAAVVTGHELWRNLVRLGFATERNDSSSRGQICSGIPAMWCHHPSWCQRTKAYREEAMRRWAGFKAELTTQPHGRESA
jgi:hypothetical protein